MVKINFLIIFFTQLISISKIFFFSGNFPQMVKNVEVINEKVLFTCKKIGGIMESKSY